MPASADRNADYRAVEREIKELERLCAELERGLTSGDWTGAANALRDSRRVTHAFLNAMDAARRWNDEAFEQAVHARMRRLFDVRQDQLERLETYRDSVGNRLREISNWKVFARSMRSKTTPRARSVGLDYRS